jgi:hypothetical protein
MMGKMLGRLGCAGSMHYDVSQRTESPVLLKIQYGEDDPVEFPVTGFDLRRDQGQNGASLITLVAREV